MKNSGVCHIPINQQLEIVAATRAVDSVDSARVLQVLYVFVEFGGCIIGQSSKRCLLPETGHKIQGMLQGIVAVVLWVVGLTLVCANDTTIRSDMRRGGHDGGCGKASRCIGYVLLSRVLFRFNEMAQGRLPGPRSEGWWAGWEDEGVMLLF